jgi:beta-N-acetylhexosaminidase
LKLRGRPKILIIGFDGTEMSPRLASLLTKIQPAGVILFARNITGAEQTHTLLRECQKCVATPLFTCVDLEGGTVDRFRNVIGRRLLRRRFLPRAAGRSFASMDA